MSFESTDDRDFATPVSQSADRDNAGQSSGAPELMVTTNAGPSSGFSEVMATIQRMESRLHESISSVSTRVDKLSETVYGPAGQPGKRTAESAPSHWADRDVPLSALPRIEWPDSDDDDRTEIPSGHQSVEVSENTSKLLASAFTSTLPNAERRRIRNNFSVPDVDVTRCPRLDALFKTQSVRSDVKTADTELARLQAFVLDPVGPLVEVLEGIDRETISAEDARSALSESLRLLGNASAQISHLRRKRVLKAVNPDIQDLADEDEPFAKASPYLFGSGFEARMKERAESVRLLKAAKPPPPKFFRSSRASFPQRGGGQTSRGSRSTYQWPKRDSKFPGRK